LSEPEIKDINAGQGQEGFTSGWGSHAILITLSIIYMSDYADRFIVASMLDFIKADWNISDAQSGWLMSIVILFLTIFSLPASILIDRWSRRKMVAIMTFFWSLATLACAFTQNYWQLMVARAFIGIGEAGYAPAGTAMLSGAYPEKKRALIMGIWNISIPLGMMVGLAAGGQIAKHYGWQHAFGLVAFPGMLLAVFAWFLPDYKNVRPEESSDSIAASFVKDMKSIFKTPSLLLTYMGFAMNVSMTTALATWLPTYFERTGIAGDGKGGLYATPVFALIIMGAPLGGVLSDKWRKRNVLGRLYFPAITSTLAGVLLFIAFQFSGNLWTQLPLLIMFGVCVTCFIAPAVSVTQDVIHPGLRAFSYAMCVIVQHILGDVWSPVIIGKLSDIFTLPKAVMVLPVWGLLAGVFFFLASRYYVDDLAKVEIVELEKE
jgi:MFS family permease